MESRRRIGFYAEYVNDRFICSLDRSPNDTAGEEKIFSKTTEEGINKAYQETNFSVTLNCSEKPTDMLSLADVSFWAS